MMLGFILLFGLLYFIICTSFLLASIIDDAVFDGEPNSVKIIESLLFPVTALVYAFKFVKILTMKVVNITIFDVYSQVKIGMVGYYRNKLKILEK